MVHLLRRRIRARRDGLACVQAVELMTDYLEGALPARRRVRFEAHLASCPACAVYLDQMRETVATLGRLDAGLLPPAVLVELVGLYRQYLAG